MTKFKTDKLVKIWFSKPENHPLGGRLNEFRLSRHRVCFPNDEINLISNFEDFDEGNQKYLKEFCAKNRITLISLRTIKKEIQDSKTIKDKQVQLDLLAIAESEIKEKFGCFAAASDIIRTLTPVANVAKLGIYSDLDLIKTDSPKKELDAPFGVLLDGNFHHDSATGEIKVNLLNNHVLACDESKTSFLIFYRELILQRYHKISDTIRRLNDKKIFNLVAYKKATDFMKDEDNNFGTLPLALKFKYVYKKYVSEQDFETFLKNFVIATSGPDCMNYALGIFLQNEFIPFCKKNKKYGQEMINLFEGLMLDYPFTNEDDEAWLKFSAKTETTLQKLDNNATALQSAIREINAKAELAELKKLKMRSH